jgi:hypothetical protein
MIHEEASHRGLYGRGSIEARLGGDFVKLFKDTWVY